MEEILFKVDEIIDKLKEDDKIKRIIELKKIIDNDSNIQSLLKEYNEGNNIRDLKITLFNNPIIKEYLSIQNELDYNIMYFNNKLSKLLDSKGCGNH